MSTLKMFLCVREINCAFSVARSGHSKNSTWSNMFEKMVKFIKWVWFSRNFSHSSHSKSKFSLKHRETNWSIDIFVFPFRIMVNVYVNQNWFQKTLKKDLWEKTCFLFSFLCNFSSTGPFVNSKSGRKLLLRLHKITQKQKRKNSKNTFCYVEIEFRTENYEHFLGDMKVLSQMGTFTRFQLKKFAIKMTSTETCETIFVLF